MLRQLFRSRPNPAQPLYEAIVAAARQPQFYAKWQVPDTVDGRFDILVLHLALAIERLQPAEPALSQSLVDVFCADMDASLRELGTGDLSVGKKVRRMAEAFMGRYQAYESARTPEAMKAAIERNVFLGQPARFSIDLANYALSARAKLAAQPAELACRTPEFA